MFVCVIMLKSVHQEERKTRKRDFGGGWFGFGLWLRKKSDLSGWGRTFEILLITSSGFKSRLLRSFHS